MRFFAFDTETIDGEPFTLQFAGPERARLFRVSRGSAVQTFINLLRRFGNKDCVSLLWAHNLEFDLGVVFRETPEIWAEDEFPLKTPFLEPAVCLQDAIERDSFGDARLDGPSCQ